MKNKIAFLVFVFIGSFARVHGQADSLSIIPQDSIPSSYEWTARSPLSAQERQQREDNRAEVEDMKRRFREFHNTSSEQETEETTKQEDQNYLWSEKDSDVSKSPSGEVPTPSNTDTDALRMEISRSFQQQPITKKADLPAQNIDPVERPEKTEAGWEEEAFQTISSSNTAWNLNLSEREGGDISTYQLGQSVILNRVQFQDHSTTLSENSKLALREWGALLNQHRNMRVEVRAHTRLDVPYTESLEVSAQRARAVSTYLRSFGLEEDQVLFRGFGKLSPLFSSSDVDNQQKNERIEVIILELPKR